ncbi:MAG: VRR-NUC domain-containing protein [Ignisphaera sp.]|nr:VRR-NUC domain-containing protein [Ignisphaera sp.]
MTEQRIQSNIIKFLEKDGHYVVKVSLASKAGVPDLLVCYKGIFVGIEVKRPETKNNTSELQKLNINKIRESGGYAFVAWDIDSLRLGLLAINSVESYKNRA